MFAKIVGLKSFLGNMWILEVFYPKLLIILSSFLSKMIDSFFKRLPGLILLTFLWFY